ncbi:hypothetical protein [Halorussus amylolyticus]|uniref:hypothetical protein n=1 Tax=Halorussus amylolyticus TaxID=1126242 RepID=UPI00138F4E9A|nr:hypothetical protein [Halorussus amylolyticus]
MEFEQLAATREINMRGREYQMILMVEPREAEELPRLDDQAAAKTLGEIGDLMLGDADTDALRTLFMWKSVAAENIQQDDHDSKPLAEFSDYSTDELRDVPLAEATSAESRLRLLEYYLDRTLA